MRNLTLDRGYAFGAEQEGWVITAVVRLDVERQWLAMSGYNEALQPVDVARMDCKP